MEFARTPGATDKTPRKRNWAKTAAIGAGAVGVVGAGAYALKRGKPLGPPKPSPSPTSTNPTPKPPSPSPSPSPAPKPPTPKPSGGFTPKQSTKLGYQKSRRLDALDKEDPEIGATARNLQEPVALSDNRAIKRRQENKRKMKEWGRRNRKSTKGIGDIPDDPFSDMPLYGSSFRSYVKPIYFSRKNHKIMNIGLIEFQNSQEQRKRQVSGLIGAAAAGYGGSYAGGAGVGLNELGKVRRGLKAKGIKPTSSDIMREIENPDGTPTLRGKQLKNRIRAGRVVGAVAGIGAQQYLHRRHQRRQGI